MAWLCVILNSRQALAFLGALVGWGCVLHGYLKTSRVPMVCFEQTGIRLEPYEGCLVMDGVHVRVGEMGNVIRRLLDGGLSPTFLR
jgi:hypothetical protein